MPAETVPEGEATGATAEPAVEALPDVLPATGAPPQPAITARQRAAAAAVSIFFLFIFIRILSSYRNVPGGALRCARVCFAGLIVTRKN